MPGFLEGNPKENAQDYEKKTSHQTHLFAGIVRNIKESSKKKSVIEVETRSRFAVGDELELGLILINDDNFKLENKKVVLQGSDYYKVRQKYPDFENIDYQILGGMVIMELSNNHFQEFDDEDNKKKGKQIQKFNRLDEFTKSKLIITKIIKGSSLAEDNIFISPCIISEVNGEEVSDQKNLERFIKI